MTLGRCRKTQNYETPDSLVFQAHIWWNKIENNKRFKTDVLRTYRGRYHLNVFSGRLEDIRRTVLKNCNNMQNLIFQYFMQHIQWSKVGNSTTVMCFLIYFQTGVHGKSQERHFRTLLGLPWNVSLLFLSKWINLIIFVRGRI